LASPFIRLFESHQSVGFANLVCRTLRVLVFGERALT